MPIKKNATKALRQAKKRAARNKIVKDSVKQGMKSANKALEAKKITAELIKDVQKKLGKAVKRGVLKQNTASRKLSRLMKKVNALSKKK